MVFSSGVFPRAGPAVAEVCHTSQGWLLGNRTTHFHGPFLTMTWLRLEVGLWLLSATTRDGGPGMLSGHACRFFCSEEKNIFHDL